MLSGCDPDCPACAERARQTEQRRIVGIRVREIVLGVWLEAIRAGERDLNRALREIRKPLLQLPATERQAVAGEFVMTALEMSIQKLPRGRRAPRLPTAWHKANRELIDHVSKIENLGKNNVATYPHGNVYVRVANLWTKWGIPSTPRQVQDSNLKLIARRSVTR